MKYLFIPLLVFSQCFAQTNEIKQHKVAVDSAAFFQHLIVDLKPPKNLDSANFYFERSKLWQKKADSLNQRIRLIITGVRRTN